MHDILSLDINSQEYHEAMAVLLTKATETPEGMRALAAAIADPIEQEIATTEIGSLLLTRHNLPVGERAVYQKRQKAKAYWLANGGDAVQTQMDEQEEVEIPTYRIASTPMIDIGVLKHGNTGTLADIQKMAAEEIRKKIDKRVVQIVSAAVPSDMVAEESGDELTDDALHEALSKLEDKELTPKLIIMRGKHQKSMRGWDLDPQTRNEMRQKGAFKVYGGADVVFSSTMPEDEVLILPDIEIGKMPVRTKLTVEPVSDPLKFKTGWLVWMEVGFGVLRSDCIAKVKILG